MDLSINLIEMTQFLLIDLRSKILSERLKIKRTK
jgi:hypothetical protein